jgi:CBS domain-containing protein
MTKNPISVTHEENRKEALDKMVKRRYRHLPVTYKDAEPIYLLDITVLTYSRLESLEKQMIYNSSKIEAMERLERMGCIGTFCFKI